MTCVCGFVKQCSGHLKASKDISSIQCAEVTKEL